MDPREPRGSVALEPPSKRSVAVRLAEPAAPLMEASEGPAVHRVPELAEVKVGLAVKVETPGVLEGRRVRLRSLRLQMEAFKF